MSLVHSLPRGLSAGYETHAFGAVSSESMGLDPRSLRRSPLLSSVKSAGDWGHWSGNQDVATPKIIPLASTGRLRRSVSPPSRKSTCDTSSTPSPGLISSITNLSCETKVPRLGPTTHSSALLANGENQSHPPGIGAAGPIRDAGCCSPHAPDTSPRVQGSTTLRRVAMGCPHEAFGGSLRTAGPESPTPSAHSLRAGPGAILLARSASPARSSNAQIRQRSPPPPCVHRRVAGSTSALAQSYQKEGQSELALVFQGSPPASLRWFPPRLRSRGSRVILTSSGLHRHLCCAEVQHEFERLCPNGSAKGLRVVYDMTGWVFDASSDGSSEASLKRHERLAVGAKHAAQLAADYGFGACDLVDLSAPGFDEAAYAVAVQAADVYYCDVGNTWALLHYLRLRGAMNSFEGVAARTRRGDLLYAGSSAGGIVAGRSAATALWKNWDDRWGWQEKLPAEARSNWSDPATMQALDIAGGVSFFPHFEPKWMQVCAEQSKQLDHQVVCCANGHGVVIEAGVPRLISPAGVPPHVPLF